MWFGHLSSCWLLGAVSRVESSEVGGCRGSGISRVIPRIPDQRFGGNGSSPDVSRRWTAWATASASPKSPRGKNVSKYSGDTSAISCHQKQSLPSPVNLDIGVNPRVIAFDLAREFSPCSELR